jgi:CBS-domain-containing membrane protein
MLIDKNYLKKIIISQDSTILEAINNLNASELKVVLIVDKNKKFIGIVNDGDIRRAFSNGFNINSSIRHSVNKKEDLRFFRRENLEKIGRKWPSSDKRTAASALRLRNGGLPRL